MKKGVKWSSLVTRHSLVIREEKKGDYILLNVDIVGENEEGKPYYKIRVSKKNSLYLFDGLKIKIHKVSHNYYDKKNKIKGGAFKGIVS